MDIDYVALVITGVGMCLAFLSGWWVWGRKPRDDRDWWITHLERVSVLLATVMPMLHKALADRDTAVEALRKSITTTDGWKRQQQRAVRYHHETLWLLERLGFNAICVLRSMDDGTPYDRHIDGLRTLEAEVCAHIEAAQAKGYNHEGSLQ